MGSFLAELRRRHIFRIAGVYVVAAWGVAQVIDLLSQTFALPDWIAQPVLIVLAIGLPFTLLAAWMIVGAAEVGDHAQSLKATGTDWLIGGGLIAVLAFMGYQQLGTSQSPVLVDRGSNSTAIPNSVAILPFDNVSPDPNDAYFAVGVHDEIISQLSRVSGLSVIARTSVLQYPGSGKTVPEIADELNVEAIMEGTVRRAGDAFRVSVNLIDALTNTPVWNDVFDGDLSDIIAIQAEIATQIVHALQVELLPSEQENIDAQPNTSPEAYSAYLRAIAAAEEGAAGVAGTVSTCATIHRHLDEAITLDPGFALAHGRKAGTCSARAATSPVTMDEWLNFKLEVDGIKSYHAAVALAFDPNVEEAYVALAYMAMEQLLSESTRLLTNRALQVSPNGRGAVGLAANMESIINDNPEAAIRFHERRVNLNPNQAFAYGLLGDALHHAGNYEEAIEAFDRCLEIGPDEGNCALWMAWSELARGNDAAALDAVRQAEPINATDSPGAMARLAYTYGVLGQAQDAQRLFDWIAMLAERQYVDPINWSFSFMGVGDYDMALEQFSLAAQNPKLIENNFSAQYIATNHLRDPKLEERQWLEVRERLRPN